MTPALSFEDFHLLTPSKGPIDILADDAQELELQDYQRAALRPVISLLKRNERLGSGSLSAVFDVFTKVYPKKGLLLTNFINAKDRKASNAISQLPYGKDNHFIFFPTLVKKGRHITLYAYDSHKDQLYYFDSQGKINWSSQGEREVLKKISPKAMRRIFAKKVAFQKDNYNCGVFVLMAMLRLMQGETFKDIWTNGWDIASDRANLATFLQTLAEKGRGIDDGVDVKLQDPYEI